jgi:hypothetical protein
MKINTELCCKRYDFLTKKTQNYRYCNYCPDDNIQIYSYDLLCEHVLSVRTVTDPLHISFICSIWKILHFYSSLSLNPSKYAFFHVLTFLFRHVVYRSEVSSKWNRCRIYVGDQLDRCRWMERTQGSATRQISR